eukprot:5481765-Pyramimonas_sp.AAC.1
MSGPPGRTRRITRMRDAVDELYLLCSTHAPVSSPRAHCAKMWGCICKVGTTARVLDWHGHAQHQA